MADVQHSVRRVSRQGRMRVILAILWGFSTSWALAQDFPYTAIDRVGDTYHITVGQLPAHYFHFQHSTDLQSFITVDMALGTPGHTFSYSSEPGALRGFFRAKAVDEWSPGDVDNDGLDDLYELKHGLNPLNPADAAFPSLENPGMTNLERYRFVYGLTRVTEYYSSETSVFNTPFGISTEISVFNFPNATGASLEAVSTEVSLYNFTLPAGFSLEAISAEVSLYNSPAVTVSALEAFSPEVSLYNSPAPSMPALDAFSPEVSVYNSPAITSLRQDAVSAEVSVFNSYIVSPAAQAISLEVSVLNTLP